MPEIRAEKNSTRREKQKGRKTERERGKEGWRKGGGREEKRREKRDRDRIVRRGKKNHRDLRIADYGEKRARSRLRGINTSRVSSERLRGLSRI